MARRRNQPRKIERPLDSAARSAASKLAARTGQSAADVQRKSEEVQNRSRQWRADKGHETEYRRDNRFDRTIGVQQAKVKLEANAKIRDADRLEAAIVAGEGIQVGEDGSVTVPGLETEEGQRAAEALYEELQRAAQVGLIEESDDDDSLWGRISGGARGVLSGAGNVVMDGLNVLDIGRATVVSGANQLGEGAAALVGRDNSFGWDTFTDNIDRRVGVNQIIEEQSGKDLGLAGDALGFVADVAVDPLTYITLGTSTAARAAGQRGAAQLGSDDVVRRVVDWGDRTGQAARAADIAADVDRVGGAAAREIADEIGIRTGVQVAGRWTVPGTQRLAEGVARTTAPARFRARQVAARAFDSNGMRTLRLNNPVAHARMTMAAENAAHLGESIRDDLGRQLVEINQRFGDADADALRAALDQGVVPADTVTREAAESMRQFFDDARDQANAVVRQATDGRGPTLARLEQYLPHHVTEAFREMRAQAGRKGRTVGRPGIRRSKLAGEQWFGETLETGSIDELNEIARRHLGDDFEAAFESDPWRIAAAYSEHVAAWVRRHVTEGTLQRHGLLAMLPTDVSLDALLKARTARAATAAAGAARADDGLAQAQIARQGAADALPGARQALTDAGDAQAFQQLAEADRLAAAQAGLDADDARAALGDAVDESERLGAAADDAAREVEAAARAGDEAGAEAGAELSSAAAAANPGVIVDFDEMGATWAARPEQVAEARARFEAMSDDDVLTVYHGTNPENAAGIRSSRVVAVPEGYTSDLPTQARDAMYVAPTRRDAAKYGDEVVAINITKGELAPSPEALRTGGSLTDAFFHSFNGAIIKGGTPLDVIDDAAKVADEVMPGTPQFEQARQAVLAQDRKLARRLREGEANMKARAAQQEELFLGYDLNEITARIDEIEVGIAGTADRAAAQAAKQSAKQADIEVAKLRREVDRLRQLKARFERSGEKLGSRMADHQIATANARIKELSTTDNVLVNAADGAVLDTNPVAEAKARLAAAKEAGEGVEAAEKALERARASVARESTALRAANKVDPAARAELERLHKIRDAVEKHGADIPHDVLREIDPKLARAKSMGEAALAKNEKQLLDQIAWAEVPPGSVPVAQADGAWKAYPIEEGRARRPRPKTEGEVRQEVRRMDAAADVIRREQGVYDAAMEARNGSLASQMQVDERIRELSDEVARADAARRLALEDEREWLDHAQALFRQADAAPDEAAAQVLRLEAIAARESAKMARYAKSSVRWHRRLAVSTDQARQVEEAIKRQFTTLSDGRWADPDVAATLKRLDELSKPREVNAILRGYDSVLSRWKAYALTSPGYHIRNGMGAYFNNWLAGTRTEAYGQFAVAMRQLGGDTSPEALARIRNPRVREAMEAVIHEEQVGGRAMGVRDFSDITNAGSQQRGILRGKSAEAGSGGRGVRGYLREVTGTSIRGNIDPTSMDNALLRLNRRTAQTVERSMRGPMYIDRFMRARAAGVSVDAARAEARAAVIKYHFDYSDLAGWEMQGARRLIPFYTWTRKNLPLQLEMMARQPGKYTVYNHAKNNIERSTVDDPFVPDYYSRLGAIRMPWQRDGRNVYWAPDLPFRDVGETLNINGARSSLSPIIKTPMEVWAGRQFFEDLPISSSYKPAPSDGVWGTLMPVLAAIPDQLTPGLGRPVKIDGEWHMRETDVYKLEQAMPLLGRVRRLAPSEDRYQSRAFTSWLSIVGGQYTMTHTEQAATSEAWRRIMALREMNENFDELNPGVRDEIEQRARDERDQAEDEERESVRAEAEARGVTMRQVRAERESRATGRSVEEILAEQDAESESNAARRARERREREERLGIG